MLTKIFFKCAMQNLSAYKHIFKGCMLTKEKKLHEIE